MFQEQIFNANGVQINFVQASASGQPIVLLHGTASEWQSFLPLIPILARNFKVYALDLRGHGKSSWVSEKYRLFDYAEDVQCFLEQHIGQPSIIYGHSLGAQIAIAVTSKIPTYIRALVLGDIPFYYEASKNRFKISLRSKETVDVEKIAGRLGGGGHVKASACRVEGNIKTVKGKVLGVIRTLHNAL